MVETNVLEMETGIACTPSVQAVMALYASLFCSWPPCQCWNGVELIDVFLCLIIVCEDSMACWVWTRVGHWVLPLGRF